VKIFIAIWIIASFFCLSSCSNSQSLVAQHRVLDKNTYASAQASDFDGPWASDIARVVQKENTDYFYNIVRDSKISDNEFQESKEKLKQCIVNRNYKLNFAGSQDFGAATIPLQGWDENEGIDSGVLNSAADVARNCDKQSAYPYVAALYYKMLWNPQKEDLVNYTIECLQKLKFLPQNVTREDYKEILGSEVPDGVPTAAVSGDSPTVQSTVYRLNWPYKDGVPQVLSVDQTDKPAVFKQGMFMIKSDGTQIPKAQSDGSVFIPYSDMIKCTLTPKSVLSEK
jgi:hypothetical protein